MFRLLTDEESSHLRVGDLMKSTVNSLPPEPLTWVDPPWVENASDHTHVRSPVHHFAPVNQGDPEPDRGHVYRVDLADTGVVWFHDGAWWFSVVSCIDADSPLLNWAAHIGTWNRENGETRFPTSFFPMFARSDDWGLLTRSSAAPSPVVAARATDLELGYMWANDRGNRVWYDDDAGSWTIQVVGRPARKISGTGVLGHRWFPLTRGEPVAGSVAQDGSRLDPAYEYRTPQFATLYDAQRAVWEYVRQHSENDGGGNCLPGSNKFLRHLGLPELVGDDDGHHEEKSAELVADFMDRARDWLLSPECEVADRSVDRYLSQFQLAPRQPLTKIVRVTVEVAADTDEQALRGLFEGHPASVTIRNITTE